MHRYIVIIVILAVVAVGFVFWSNKCLVNSSYVYRNEKIKDDLKGFRITQVSDLQSEYFGKNQKRLIEMVKGTEPDIIVFTGDLVDRNHTDYEAARIAMEGLCAIAPVYYVNGNHEMSLPEDGIENMYDTLRKMGVIILLDKWETVNVGSEKINLIGLSENTLFRGRGYEAGRGLIPIDINVVHEMLNSISEDLRKDHSDGLNVLLTHEPQYLEDYGKHDYDLIFAGHAHGGQIRLPFTEGLFSPGQGKFPKLTAGVHKSGNSTMIISRGLGNSVFPIRFCNRPEIVTVVLEKNVN